MASTNKRGLDAYNKAMMLAQNDPQDQTAFGGYQDPSADPYLGFNNMGPTADDLSEMNQTIKGMNTAANMQPTQPPAGPPPSNNPLSAVPVPEKIRAHGSLAAYQGAAKEAALQQQGGIDQLSEYIDNFRRQPQQTNYVPLAAFADYLSGGGEAMKAAQALAPMSQEGRTDKFLKLQEELQKRKEAQSKTLMEPLKEQMQLYMQFVKPQVYAQAAQDRLDERLAHQAHQQVLNKLDRDPILQKQLAQTTNIQNALRNVANAQHLTPQQFDELQQTVRSNLGIKGSSGVDERHRTMLDSMGLNYERMQQLLTGKPADINKNDAFLAHIKDLAGLELGNIQNITQSRIDSLAEGNGWVYDDPRFANLKRDFERKVKKVGTQYIPKSALPTEAAGTAGGGETGPHGPSIVQGGHQFNWNPQTKQYE